MAKAPVGKPATFGKSITYSTPVPPQVVGAALIEKGKVPRGAKTPGTAVIGAAIVGSLR